MVIVNVGEIENLRENGPRLDRYQRMCFYGLKQTNLLSWTKLWRDQQRFLKKRAVNENINRVQIRHGKKSSTVPSAYTKNIFSECDKYRSYLWFCSAMMVR